MQDSSIRMAAFIAISCWEISLSLHETDDYAQIGIINLSFGRQNESDVIRRIPVKVKQYGVLDRLYSRAPIHQERRQTFLHVRGQSPDSDS